MKLPLDYLFYLRPYVFCEKNFAGKTTKAKGLAIPEFCNEPNHFKLLSHSRELWVAMYEGNKNNFAANEIEYLRSDGSWCNLLTQYFLQHHSG